MTDEQKQGRVRAALVTVQMLFGINYLVSKQVVGVLDPAAWATLRATSALVILGAAALLLRRRFPRGRDVWYLAGCAMLGVTLNQILFLEGLSRTTPAHASLICAQIPLFTLAAAVAMRREPLTGAKVAALVSGMIGVMVLLEVDRFSLESEYLVGDLLVLTNAVCFGLFVALSGRVMARHDPLGAVTVVFLFGSAGIALYGADELLATAFGTLSSGDFGRMAYVVVGATVGTYFLNLFALKHTQASRVALYIFLQPVVATTLSVAILGEALTWRLLVAGALVLVSLSLRERSRRVRPA
ncbi:EamA family transporter [bacterium]|nr:EamA family transporter [bacterium]